MFQPLHVYETKRGMLVIKRSSLLKACWWLGVNLLTIVGGDRGLFITKNNRIIIIILGGGEYTMIIHELLLLQRNAASLLLLLLLRYKRE